MIQVTLLNRPENPIYMASHAARTCYEARFPDWGKTLKSIQSLWEKGHHTIFQHTSLTYRVQGVSVGDVTFGLHLASPFYNSDQRSGRFCSEMFSDPNMAEKMMEYIREYWDIDTKVLERVVAYIRHGLSIFQNNKDEAAQISADFLKKERPSAGDKYIGNNARKIAQEQLRMFVPVISPTGLDFTVSLTALAALYRVAWSPTLRDMTQKMADCITARYPDIAFVFQERKFDDTEPAFNEVSGIAIKDMSLCVKPGCRVTHQDDLLKDHIKMVSHEDMFPLDLLPFMPRHMGLNTEAVCSEVEISIATMGQDQRHRTVRRSHPIFTGSFYVPPIVDALGIRSKGLELMEEWFSFKEELSPTLLLNLAPYGAMVQYKKSASLTALLHELQKRTCWCAQEEIYHVAIQLLEGLGNKAVAQYFAPPCFRTGKCGEGNRYCGRSLKEIKSNLYLERRV